MIGSGGAKQYAALRRLVRPHAGQRGHRQGDHHVDLVRGLFFTDFPAARALNGHRARHRQANFHGRIGDQVAGSDELEKVAAHFGQVADRLRQFDHRQTFACQALRHADHLIWVIDDASDLVAVRPIQQRVLNHALEVDRALRAWGEDAVIDEAHLLLPGVVGDSHKRGRVVLEFHRIENGPDRVANDVVAAQVPTQGADQRQVDEVAPQLEKEA